MYFVPSVYNATGWMMGWRLDWQVGADILQVGRMPFSPEVTLDDKQLT